MLRFLVAMTVLVPTLLLTGSGVAAAHAGGLDPSASLPRILAVVPPVPGLTVEVIEWGARVRLDNGTGDPVDVLPVGATREREPVVPPGGTARWADPRVEAAALVEPAVDTRAWSIPLKVGDRAVTVHGERFWPPAPPGGLWWLATAGAVAAATVLGVRASGSRAAAIGLGATTLLVVGAHVVHVLGASLVPQDQVYAVVALDAAGVGIAAWLVGGAGVVLTLARRQAGVLLCGLAGAVLATVTAFDTVSFTSAVLPFDWPPDLDRATTVLTFGAGAGLFLAGFAALRRLTPDSVPEDAAPR